MHRRLAEPGYSGVQVAPPQNSVKRTELGNGSDTVLHPWWEVYQPVTYDLTSRMGNETQFKNMVKACRKVGVKVYVDAVINHMTGQGHTSYGGQDYTPVPLPEQLRPGDFHFNTGECPSSDGGIQDFNNKPQVFKCNLVGLEDLDTDTDKVQSELAGYLNKLIGYGVSGLPGRRRQAHRPGRPGRHLLPAESDQGPQEAVLGARGLRRRTGILSPQAFTRSGDVLGLDGGEADPGRVQVLPR